MARAFLGLGSNLGDRQATLLDAIQRLQQTDGIQDCRCSSFYETAPVGPVQQGDYLNAVVEIKTSLEPMELFQSCQRLEKQADRVREVRWGPRTLDIDILAFDDVSLNSPELTLPHAEACRRAFVLVPWAELAPDFMLLGKAVADWLQEVGHEGVRKFD
ncbi:2-amino-4-hydroxy-6-hydroxymethyldihydropteridine diphosphokinase [Cerasicoccus fimbriatus]|uniref:2-amino-4-hydroxy-6- hydroxymethyldihydropteridine diphosphokinase n=1 Tax=Cerasicoccus fimbriatus TaxID=3014554 RepID=UPI0022B57861|nr:2-amino-4-hydroxy-6-hydroxymethyldihydropteridine diphosphokinase [Cerasicoccus sp. TK19100]